MRPPRPLRAALVLLLTAHACIAPAQSEPEGQSSTPKSISHPAYFYTLILPEGWAPLDAALLEEINQRARAADPKMHYHAAYLPDAQPSGGSVYILMQFTPGMLAAQSLDQIESTIVAAMAESFPSDTISALDTTLQFHPARLDRATHRITQRVPLLPPDAPESPTTGVPIQITTSVGLIGAEGIIWAHAYFPESARARSQPEIDALTSSLTFADAYAYTEPRRSPSRSSPTPSTTPPSTPALTLFGPVAVGIVALLLLGLIAVARRSHASRPDR